MKYYPTNPSFHLKLWDFKYLLAVSWLCSCVKRLSTIPRRETIHLIKNEQKMPLQITVFGKMMGTFVFSVVQPEIGFGFVSSFKPPLPYKFLWFFLVACPCWSSAGISPGRFTKLLPTLSSSCASCSSFVDVGSSRAYSSILGSVFPFSWVGNSLLQSQRTIT